MMPADSHGACQAVYRRAGAERTIPGMEEAGAPGKSGPSCCGAGWIHSVNREEYSRVCSSETHKGSREALFCRASELRSRQMQSMAHYEWIERIGGTEMDPENASYPSKSDKSWSEARQAVK